MTNPTTLAKMRKFKATISKEEVNQLQPEVYRGNIHIVQTEEQAAIAVEHLRKQAIVGFDTETRPSFVKGESHTVALVQLSDGNHTFLFRINKMGIPEVLEKFFNCRKVLKIGLSTKDDFRALRNVKHSLKFARFVELQTYVTQYGIDEKSLTKIYSLIFDKRISKAQRLTNWEADTLTDKQKQYAALDAFATRRIFTHLEELREQGFELLPMKKNSSAPADATKKAEKEKAEKAENTEI